MRKMPFHANHVGVRKCAFAVFRGRVPLLRVGVLLASVRSAGCVQLLGVDLDDLHAKEDALGPVPVRVVPMLTAGGYHTCHLAIDGRVQCVGIDFPSIGQSPSPADVSALDEPVRSLADSDTHLCAITLASRARCWGQNNHGQLGPNGSTTSAVAVDVGLSNVKALSAGTNHTCALLDDGTLRCWGAQHRIGVAVPADSSDPVALSSLRGVVEIVSGLEHACARAETGIFCWGDNSKGQLGSAVAEADEPVPVEGLPTPVDALFAFGWTTCANVGGDLYCWGRWDDRLSSSIPRKASAVRKALAMAGSRHICHANDDGNVACWGPGSAAPTGTTKDTSAAAPFLVPTGGSVISVAAGYVHTCALAASGEVLCWGSNDQHQFGEQPTCTPVCREPVRLGF